MSAPWSYSSMEEFEREEIRPHNKLGWSIDDLFQEAELKRRDPEQDEPQELDFGF